MLQPLPCKPDLSPSRSLLAPALPCPGNDLQQDLRTIKLLGQGCRAQGAPSTPPPGSPHLSPPPAAAGAFGMLLRHFQALIGHGEVRDKAFLSTTRPEGFGTVEQQEQEQLPLHGGQSPGQPRPCSHPGDSGGSPRALVPSAAPTLLCPPQPLDFPLPDITCPLTLQQQHLCHRITRDESAGQGTVTRLMG